MCGIFFAKSKVGNEIINYQNIEMIYDIHKERGPDEKNHIFFKDWMMVHTRLSITSPDQGQQPIFNKNKNAYMIFNGEIYNYQSLAKEFNILDNNDFSDTDILFKLINKIGFYSAIEKLRGMFAIVFYDLINKKIYTARDHFGQKPLWIYEDKNTIAFSSTIKALVKVFKTKLDNKKILHLLSKQGKSCSSLSIYKDISGLKAGEILEIDGNLNKKFRSYFKLWV